jgi:hypothetical protein
MADTLEGPRGEVCYEAPGGIRKMAIKRRSAMAGASVKLPAADTVSVILGKCPVMREFLAARQYEDGSARSPGVLRLTTQGSLWELVIQDPDAAARLTLRDPKLDHLLVSMDTLLVLEEAPWETDRYLAERLAKPRKKN